MVKMAENRADAFSAFHSLLLIQEVLERLPIINGSYTEGIDRVSNASKKKAWDEVQTSLAR